MVVTPARRSAEDGESPRELIVFATAVVTATVALMAALFVVRHVVVLLYVCVLLAIGFSPVVRGIEHWYARSASRRRIPRWLVVLLIYAAIIAALAAVAMLVAPAVGTQIRDVAARGPAMVEPAQRFLETHGMQRVSAEQLANAFPPTSDIVGTTVSTLSGMAGGVAGVVTILILTFFILLEADDLTDASFRLFPSDARRRAHAVAGRITEKISAWLSGQLLLMAIVGASATVVLGVLGVPFFYVLGILAGLAELVPFAGPFVVGALATVVALSVSWKIAVAVAVYYVLQQLIESNLLVPKLMGHKVGLSGTAVLVAVLVGHALLGVSGAILAIPTAAIVKAAAEEFAPEQA
jgi:predicted PurR-regulated permease PerM